MIPLSYNIRNLRVRKATTVATAFGIALVVFVLAASLMLSEGLGRTMARTGKDDHAIVMRKGSDAELPSSIPDSSVGLIRGAPGVKQGPGGQPMGIGEVVVVVFAKLVDVEGRSNVQVRGVPSDVMEFRPEVRIVEGRPAQPGTDEAVVGKAIAGRFVGLSIGDGFNIRKNRDLKIVGVFDAGGSSFESEVWGDLDTVRDSMGRTGYVSSVRVQLESSALFDGFEAAVEQDKRLGLEAMSETDFYARQSEGMTIFLTAMGGLIALFFSVGAMIGAMITMYGAVSMRRAEVGVLRALGFSRTAILASFLFESFILAMIGGAFGAAASLALGLVEFNMMNFQSFSEIVFKFEPTAGIIITALIFGGAMGILGGFLPALRAARTSAIEAMRG